MLYDIIYSVLFHGGDDVEMSRIISKITRVSIALLLSLTLSINVFASGTVSEISIDGSISGRSEWGNQNRIDISGNYSIDGIEMADVFVVSDNNTHQICFGFRITEKESLTSSSAVKVYLDDDFSAAFFASGKVKPALSSIEFKTQVVGSDDIDTVSSTQYFIETRIDYSKLNDKTKVKIQINNRNGTESPMFVLNLADKSISKEEATPETTAKPTTTKEQTTNSDKGSTTTKKDSQTSTSKSTTSTTKSSQSSLSENSTAGKSSTTKSKSSKTSTTSRTKHLDLIGSILKSETNESTSSQTVQEENQEVPLADVANVQDDVFDKDANKKNNTKKIVIISLAIGLMAVAAALPLIKNIKSKKEENS